MLLCLVAIDKIFFAQASLGWISGFSIGYMLLYCIAMRAIFVSESKLIRTTEQEQSPKVSLTRSIGLFIFFSIMIVFAALALPGIADKIGAATGLSDTFIGSSLVAITTSLPEVVVSLAAARMGAFDMAVGNVLGSNLFNVAILGLEDICYSKGPILANASNLHAMSAIAAVICTACAVIGITFRAEKKKAAITWDSAGIVACYLATSYWLFVSK